MAGWVPRGIVYRPKTSASGPRQASARNDLREVINAVLVEGQPAGSGMIRADMLRRLVQDEQVSRKHRTKPMWQLLTLELW